MRRKKIEKKERGLKTLVLYGFIVFFLIFVSFAIRAFNLVKESKFDGVHRFTVAVGEKDHVLRLISFEPMTSSLSYLTFSHGSITFSNLDNTLGIIPDAYVKTENKLILQGDVPGILQSFLINSGNISTNVNFYDLIRFYWYAKRISASSIRSADLSDFSNVAELNKTLSLLLTDKQMASENISIQIVNASGKSGIGGRLARVISNLGGNVVSIKTSLKADAISKIQYYGEETYTLRKLEKLLQINRGMLEREDIAKIVIIMGEDIEAKTK